MLLSLLHYIPLHDCFKQAIEQAASLYDDWCRCIIPKILLQCLLQAP